MNKPVVVLCNEGFSMDARSAAISRGIPGLRIVPESVPPESCVKEQVERGVNSAMDDLVAALTQPLTMKEMSPKSEEVKRLPRIVFKGNLEEVVRFFYKRGWTDGLPIIPPTEEAVKEMLTGTDLPPDHVVGKIPPFMGKATVEKIAINAVLAGALPTYMPVLIAGVQALIEPKAYFGTYQVSTGSWAPFLIISGSVRKDLNINSGSGALSPGDIANATIGRAMNLIIKNIGGARKGIEDMGVYGNPMRYSMVIAENEEESPWEPLHVEHGFAKGESTITLYFPNLFLQMLAYGTDDKGILKSLVYNVVPGRKGLSILMVTPAQARILAENGWAKKDIKAFIAEYGRAPAYHHPEYWGGFPERKSKWLLMSAQDSIPVFSNPDQIRILVAGGPGMWVGLVMGAAIGETDWVMKKVELPQNWNKLVEKYKVRY